MKADTKILIVEDERIVGEDIQNSLLTIGYSISGIVSSGETALEEIEKNAPDLVLMDIVLGSKLNGIEAADRIKVNFDIPVVYLTAYADKDTLERAKLTEPFGYIVKPFDIQSLQSTIEMALYKYRMEKKLKDSKARIAAVLRSIADGVIATDKMGNVTLVNSIAEQLIGSSQEKMIGDSIDKVLNLIDEKSGKSVENSWNKLKDDRQSKEISRNYILLTNDGRRIPVDSSIAPIKNDKGDFEGVVKVFKDITGRRKAEQALQYRYKFESTIAKISSNFIKLSSQQIDSSFIKALKELCSFAECQGCCLFLYSQAENYFFTQYKWFEVQIGSQLNSLVSLVVKSENYITEALKRNKKIFVSSLKDIPEGAEDVKEWYGENNFRSFFFVPIFFKGSVYGALGFYSKENERKEWSDDVISLMKTVSDMFINVLERKRAEENLNISEQRYRGLFETMNSGVIYFDNYKQIIACNPTAEDIFEMDRSEMIGSELKSKSWKFISEEGNKLTKRENPVDIAFRTGKPVLNYILGLILKNKKEKWLLINITPVNNSDKESPQSVFMIFTDITQRKEIELVLKKRNFELNALNIIANVVSGTLDLRKVVEKALDEILHFMDFSKGVLFLFDEDNDIINLKVRRNISDNLIRKLTEQHNNKFSEYWKKLRMGEVNSLRINKYLDVTKQEIINKKLPQYCLLVPIREGGDVIGFLNFFRNRKFDTGEFGFYFFSNVGNQIGLAVKNARLYERANRTLEELKITQARLVESEKLAGLGAMANSVVHEIGNPLGAISNSIQVLQRKVNLSGRMKELMDIIGWETERLNRSIDQLRELSRKRKYNFKLNDFIEIVKRGILIINQDFELVFGKDISVHFSQNVPMTLLDSDAIEQVVINLLKNALQAVGEGDRIEIIVKNRKRGKKRYLILEIKDNGRGIPEENFKNIFEPYFTTKSKGMGLGMYVVKQIVEAHNGKIKISSEVGKGTTVCVIIPVIGEDNDQHTGS